MRRDPSRVVIRSAIQADAQAIRNLLVQLGYPQTALSLREKIERLRASRDEELAVADMDGRVVGVISVHFIPQLALAGDFARISYFCVEKGLRGRGIGHALEAHGRKLAEQRGCDRIEVHCAQRRALAHRFYFGLGYHDSPKYLVRSLSPGRTRLPLTLGRGAGRVTVRFSGGKTRQK